MNAPLAWSNDVHPSWRFSASEHLPLTLVEAATLLSYQTPRDAQDQDIPAAAAFLVSKNTDYTLGAVLLELALRGRLQLDETPPLENYAFYADQRQRQRSLGRLWFLVLPGTLFLAGVIAILQAQRGLALVFALGFMASIVLTILFFLVRGLLSGEKMVQGNLAVVDPTPTGDAILDEVLAHMHAARKSCQADRWLYGRGALKARDLFSRAERRLAAQGWITLTGPRRVLGLFEVETLVINRQTDRWQGFREQVRSALLQDRAVSPDMLALLLCLTVMGSTFQRPHQLRLPGQPAGQRVVSGLYYFLESPEELVIGRQRLQRLMGGDPLLASTLGSPLYETLLSIRNGIEQSIEAKRTAASG